LQFCQSVQDPLVVSKSIATVLPFPPFLPFLPRNRT